MDHHHHRNAIYTPHWKGGGGTSTVSGLNRPGGGFKVDARALDIIWGNDGRFWQWVTFSEDDTRSIGFKEGAMLIQVNWIEITGKIPLASIFKLSGNSSKKFEIFYVVKFKVDAFGWHSVPLKLKLKINGEEKVNKSIVVESLRKKHDVWHEISGGEFTILTSDQILEFGMLEVESDWWKGGMLLAGVKILPKE